MKKWLIAALVALALAAAPVALANHVKWKFWIDCGSLAGDGKVYFIIAEEPHAYSFSCGREA